MFELEFFPVGEGARAGDAICSRYIVDDGFRVLIVDGGTDASGEAMVNHIRRHYGEHQVVHDVVLTHPDGDHSSGLRQVLRELPVRRLWLHGLWHHAAEMVSLFQDPRWTATGLAQAIRDEYPIIAELLDIAQERGIAVQEPFAGQRIGAFTVLSPSRPRYLHLVPQFRKTPDPRKEVLEDRGIWVQPRRFFSGLLEAALAKMIAEGWFNETLREGGKTSSENESSAVLLGHFGQEKVLLTGDAGCLALGWAMDYADASGLDRRNLTVVQVPHHGSRNNVSPSILNRLLGPIRSPDSPSHSIAVASVPKDDSTHPRRVVANAFRRRGFPVRKTQGVHYRVHSGGMPDRGNTSSAVPLPFFDEVEEYT